MRSGVNLVIISTCMLWFSGPVACAATDAVAAVVAASDAPPKALEAQILEIMAEHGIPGVAFAVVSSEGLQVEAAYGEARPGVPVTTQTMFNTASLTKFLTSELVLRLADDGLFKLDEPMAPVFVDPDVADDPRALQLTPRHALAHQSGFPNWRHQNENNQLAFDSEPGTRPGYSGEGYNYVARYVSELTGQGFVGLLRQHVLTPANARLVGFEPPAEGKDLLAWSKKPDGSFSEASRQPWSAADDLYASAGDFGRVLSTMLDGRSLSPELTRERRLIAFDMSEQFCARPDFGEICPQKLGFTLTGIAFEYADETVYWQGGGDVGERAVAFVVPARDLGIVILTNGSHGGRVFEAIAAMYYDNQRFTRFLGIQGQQ